VRGDFLYRHWTPRKQAKFDLVLYFLFFFPGILALIYAGWDFFYLSWLLNEKSAYSPQGPIIWPFKFFIPFVGVIMVLQGAVEVTRCVMCIRTGVWPPRRQDVEETEKEALERGAAALEAERKGART
jgi:TRAP-type mannitol/chloroaromatic compound transport system permease small subunit